MRAAMRKREAIQPRKLDKAKADGAKGGNKSAIPGSKARAAQEVAKKWNKN